MRLNAIWALGEKGGKEAVDILTSCISQSPVAEKREILKALKKIVFYPTTPSDLQGKINNILLTEKKKGWII